MPQPHRPVRPHGTTPSRQQKPTSNNTTSSRTSTNAIKKRKRDLRRLLEHAEKLPANIRISHERELASCDTELETAKEMARRSQMIKKYHMVRFFERRKAERYLKKARQRLIECSDATQLPALQEDLHLCDVDLQYTLYHPLNEVYSSLYKKDGKDREKEAEAEGTHEVDRSAKMWKVVEAAMVSNQLGDLREGRLRKKSGSGPNTGKQATVMGKTGSLQNKKKETNVGAKNDKKVKQQKLKPDASVGDVVGDVVMDDEDETGAGFFEV